MTIQLAADAPELVAGLVLLDPTPITSRTIASTLGASLRVMSAATHLPVVGPLLAKGMAASLRKQFTDVEWTPLTTSWPRSWPTPCRSLSCQRSCAASRATRSPWWSGCGRGH